MPTDYLFHMRMCSAHKIYHPIEEGNLRYFNTIYASYHALTI